MAGQLRQAASQLGSSAGRSAQIYEVIVKEPAGGVNDPKAGGLIAQTIMNKWSQNGFPDDGILLVLTRSAADPNQWMAGARLGRSFAGSVGLPELGNALSANIQMLRGGDYRGYSVAVTGDIAHLVASKGVTVRTQTPFQPVRPVIVVHQQGALPRTRGCGSSWASVA